MSDYLTTTQVAEILGLTRVRVWQLIAGDVLGATRMGRDWFVTRDEVKRYQESKK